MAKVKYSSERVSLIEADCFDWLRAREPHSIQAVVTDPPYGVIEYETDNLLKLRQGRGGIWRIPPTLNGYQRAPLPRFTVHTEGELAYLFEFFRGWAELLLPVLVPGAHVFIATNPLLAPLVYSALITEGLEHRGEMVRLVTTLRGGDRPKGAEKEFQGVTVMPKSNHEPWGVFRKPAEGTVAHNLRRWGTGGLRRTSESEPFADVFRCPPAGQAERAIAPHPSLKPQALMRYLVRASLPLGTGIVLDPFAGSGSTLAAAEALGYSAIGLERDHEYAVVAQKAIPALAAISAGSSAAIRDQLPLAEAG